MSLAVVSAGVLVVKNSSANAGDIRDMGLIPGSGRCTGGGDDSSLQYSCLDSMAPYCLERKSRLPTLTSGALPDLTRHGLAQAPWSRVGGLWFCFFFVHRTDSTHQSWDSVPYSVDSYYHPDITPHNPVPGPLKKKINKWVLISLKRIHPI